MAQSVRSSPIAFVAEVARFLAVDPDDVQEMIRSSQLPAIKIPAKTHHVFRIPLREFHAWLRAKSDRTAYADYDVFLADFDATARTKAA